MSSIAEVAARSSLRLPNGIAPHLQGLSDHVHVPATLPRKWHFYPAMALAGWVWSVTPTSWIIFLAALYRRCTGLDKHSNWLAWGLGASSSSPLIGKFFFYYSFLEVPFSIYLFLLTRKANRRTPPPKVDNKTLEDLMLQCLDVGLAAHPPRRRGAGKHAQEDSKFETHVVSDQEAAVAWKRLMRWFYFEDPNEIKADNVRQWLAWAFAGRELEECKGDKDLEYIIERAFNLVQARLKHTFAPGFNTSMKTLRLTLDPVATRSRPLGYYAVCNGITGATKAWLRHSHGFRYEQVGDCAFLVKDAVSKAHSGVNGVNGKSHSKPLPILFLHGLGIGLGQYAAFLKYLARYEHGVYILLQPNISADIWHKHYLDAPNKDQHIASVKSLAKRHKIESFQVLSHSNGTMVTGWVARGAPELCKKHVIVDPVSFRLWEGATCYAFIARPWATGVEVLLGYFVARELGIAHTIARRFIWSDMLLWVHDLPEVLTPDNVQLIFGERDMLLDVPASVDYLRSAGVPAECIHVLPKYQHGKALFIDAKGMHIALHALGME
ncbi:hypothetical protein IE81DRAFT_181524 [Ceraceosorus guamensis]|uniref:Alpha/beta-hydrolase n=1 Tax=Ceraceosorus guamensis TaxID=1522189 RepID=A0A316VVC2_9BASI|nr:hypothetical protein IE81DRAFT_181524 [Ceraceosorus guamensis]PWN41234.1 hypothetical protein IE81DRAFT_181524 [Ceraceosorus guamensis]